MKIMLTSLADGGSAARSLEAVPGTPLSRALWLSGLLPAQAMCSGLGRCGRCRVRFCEAADRPPSLPDEEEILGGPAVEKGWRLACRRQVPDVACLRLEVPVPFAPAPATAVRSGGTAGVAAALGVDLGTTSIYYRAVRQDDGALLAEGHFLNPQAGAGADVMSRLATARQEGMAEKLAALAREAIREGLTATCAAGGRVEALCVAGNTAMTDILLERSVEGLCAAPYRLDYAGHDTVRLPDLPPVYVPPLMAPFVGGDISAGLAALMAAGTPRPWPFHSPVFSISAPCATGCSGGAGRGRKWRKVENYLKSLPPTWVGGIFLIFFKDFLSVMLKLRGFFRVVCQLYF